MPAAVANTGAIGSGKPMISVKPATALKAGAANAVMRLHGHRALYGDYCADEADDHEPAVPQHELTVSPGQLPADADKASPQPEQQRRERRDHERRDAAPRSRRALDHAMAASGRAKCDTETVSWKCAG